jgi:glycosyltransferase involved in cell wall biosynthesis
MVPTKDEAMETTPSHTSQATSPTVLMVSKPVAPPWNDSSKNLVKDLAQAGRDFTYRVMTPKGYELAGYNVRSEPIYSDHGRYTPPVRQNLRVFARLLRRDDSHVTHFFFAPNPKTAVAAKVGLLARPRRTVQTVCSIPLSFERPARLLFAERVITLSQSTRERIAATGFPEQRLTHIPPAIDVPSPLSEQLRQSTRRHYRIPADHIAVVYAGDYQFSRAAETVAKAACKLRDEPISWVFACRIKQPASRDNERTIDAILSNGGVRSKALLLNEVPDMLTLLGACDVCTLPTASLYAKMDIPLVLLEAMSLRVPVIVADRPPVSELLDGNVGCGITPEDPDALASCLSALLKTPDRRRRMGDAARQMVQGTYAIDAVSRRHEQLYRELLSTR